MPRYICKFEDGDKNYYMEWSTVVDAPVTWGLSLEEFEDHYRQKYGDEGMRYLPNRMERVEAKGTSSELHDSLEDLIGGYNRAGKNETFLTLEQIVDSFCRNRDEDKIPEGKKLEFEEG